MRQSREGGETKQSGDDGGPGDRQPEAERSGSGRDRQSPGRVGGERQQDSVPDRLEIGGLSKQPHCAEDGVTLPPSVPSV